MTQAPVKMTVRKVSDRASIVDIEGDVTAACEDALMQAYANATTDKTSAIILNFNRLEYMNSGGIGMLVTLLIRANRQRQRLLAFGLNQHYQQIFQLTRLDEAIGIHESELEALAAAGAS
jgi:anti-sigma B factor antagonist